MCMPVLCTSQKRHPPASPGCHVVYSVREGEREQRYSGNRPVYSLPSTVALTGLISKPYFSLIRSRLRSSYPGGLMSVGKWLEGL